MDIALAVLILLAAIGGGTFAIIAYIRRKAAFLAKQIHLQGDVVQETVWSARALTGAMPPGAIIPRPGLWTLDAAGLGLLQRLIEEGKPSLVVELGSGLSTIVIAARLAQAGHGRVVSVEHDARYADATRSYLRANGLHAVAEVRTAPLSGQSGGAPWYDMAAFEDLQDINLLLVDGPPMPIAPRVREPALDRLRDRLAPGAVLVLDDAQRPGEREVLAAWHDRHGARPEIHFTGKQMATLRL